MLGMGENMMDRALKNIDKPMMKEIDAMTSSMMGNLSDEMDGHYAYRNSKPDGTDDARHGIYDVSNRR
jgi:hypothetical protein